MRADGEAMVWSASAPMAELLARLADAALPLEVTYGEQTYPEMHASADAICAAVPSSGPAVVARREPHVGCPRRWRRAGHLRRGCHGAARA